jgi:hypothetical protein
MFWFRRNKNSPRGGTDYIWWTASIDVSGLEQCAKEPAEVGTDKKRELAQGLRETTARMEALE